jgi:NAD dependent epimerase/dehydratase
MGKNKGEKMTWRKKKVLVTGAGGFIASHLVEKLVDSGAEVTCFIRYNSRGDIGMIGLLPKEKKKRLRIVAGDLRDSDAIRDITRKKDVVFHLGALISIPYSYVHPREFVETNIVGTLNILTSSLRNKVAKIVHTSTSEVYGTARYVPIDEKHPLQGQSPYSASKIGADKLAESFYLSYNLPVATIRPFNTYGPRQSSRSVIPTIIMQALKSENIHLGSLGPTRDFTFVDDMVEAFFRVAESNVSAGKVINIGSNFEISVTELVEKVSRLMGKKLKIIRDSARTRPVKSEVNRLWADNRKAKKLLGWKPKVSLEEGLLKTIDYISMNFDRYTTERYII